MAAKKKITKKETHTNATPSGHKEAECFFCQENVEPDYKQPDILDKFTSSREKIVGAQRSGVCAKHQRKLSMAIKRARHLGLLPFAVKVS